MYEEEYEYEEEDEYYAIRPNKSQIKREMAELAEFVKELVALPIPQLEQLELDENLYKAVITGMHTDRGAHKRQLKYIVGLLRKIDIAPIQEKLARLQSKSAHAVREHHMTERWRDRLISGSETELTQLLDEFPDADRQQLRQLVRNAKKEHLENATPKYTRALYQFIKKMIEHHADASDRH
jgi:ribosome-associated protein